MKKTILSISICIAGIICFAQNAHTIKNANAFYMKIIPGMNMKDDNGNTVNPVPVITRTLYIESKEKPVLQRVSYNGIAYIPTVSAQDSNTVNAGVTTQGNPVQLKPHKGYSIWKVDLVLQNEKDKAPENVNTIALKGKTGKYNFSYTVKKETELTAPAMY
jgi:hypothetical protein